MAIKYPNYLVLLVKKKGTLQDTLDKKVVTRRWYGMEINIEKSKVMKIANKSFHIFMEN